MHRTAAVIAVALAALVSTAAAGAGRAQAPFSITAVENAYLMPRTTVTGAVVAIRFRNAGKELHEFAFGRIDGDHTLAELLRLSGAGAQPRWLHDLGGPGPMTPGADLTITRTLKPGRYVVFDGTPNHAGVSHWKLGMARTFTVEGTAEQALPRTDAVITAHANGFAVPVLRAGRQTIELRNRAGAPRGFMLASLRPGKTEADVGRWTKRIESTGKLPAGPVPMMLLGAMQTIPSGTSVFVTLTLEKGRAYHLSDDESGLAADFTVR